MDSTKKALLYNVGNQSPMKSSLSLEVGFKKTERIDNSKYGTDVA